MYTDKVVTVRYKGTEYTAVVVEDFGDGMARVAVIDRGDSWHPPGTALTVATHTLELLGTSNTSTAEP